MPSLPKIDIDHPKYDQRTYSGRFKHFFLLTNPLNILATDQELEHARRIVMAYRKKNKLPRDVKTVDDLWRAKYLYDSAYHPDTGEKSILIGRISAQMPMNTLITGCMLSFHKSMRAVIFWQWFNQTFNAIVNYTNRAGSHAIERTTLIQSYCMGTGGALVTALSLNHLVSNMKPLVGRLVPLAAVSAANCINVPMMRINELRHGITLVDNRKRKVGVSRRAAALGIAAVVVSRIGMALPDMLLTPLLVEYLERRGTFKRFPTLYMPLQTTICGIMLIFTTPMGCAFFGQHVRLSLTYLEADVQEKIRKEHPKVKEVWYNRGL